MRNESNQTTSQRLALPVGDVAELLGVSERHVWKLTASGRLPRLIRLGRSVRWRADELKAWIDAGCPARDRWVAMQEGQR